MIDGCGEGWQCLDRCRVHQMDQTIQIVGGTFSLGSHDSSGRQTCVTEHETHHMIAKCTHNTSHHVMHAHTFFQSSRDHVANDASLSITCVFSVDVTSDVDVDVVAAVGVAVFTLNAAGGNVTSDGTRCMGDAASCVCALMLVVRDFDACGLPGELPMADDEMWGCTRYTLSLVYVMIVRCDAAQIATHALTE